MKKIISIIVAFWSHAVYAQGGPLEVLKKDLPIDSIPGTDSNPIRLGAKSFRENLIGLGNSGTEDIQFDSSLAKIISQINIIINYALGLLALIALIYLIYHGFKMLFAFNKDDAFSDGMKGMKTAAIALVGIGMSRIIVRFIFFIISYIAG